MPKCRIDRDQFEQAYDELSDRCEWREAEVLFVTGTHEDHGRVTLRREAGEFTIVADDLSLVRPWGVVMERAADD